MDAVVGLTWHAGSVLPFASLWHTLHRLMRLNAMRTKELPQLFAGSWQAPSVRAVNLLFNEVQAGNVQHRAGALQTRCLARALGEPAHGFNWSHLGRLPAALRCLVTPGFRLCSACIAEGYHSALFSLKALDRCPIHRCELISNCRCGEPFEPVLKLNEATHAGRCRCGQLAFFTRTTCRRPDFSADDIRAMRPIAAWLEDLCTVVRPWGARKFSQEAHDQVFLMGLGSWCRQLGLSTPPSAQRAPCPAGFATATISSGALTQWPRARAAEGLASEPSFTAQMHGSMWQHSEATVAYRAMTRHIRRHVGRRSERYALRFLQHPDPLEIAQQMQAEPQAMVAFAELVFCFAMERFAMNRRWPYRRALDATERVLQDKLADPWFHVSCGPEKGLDLMERGWIARQVAAGTVTHAWRRAQACALAAIRSGLADWRSATEQVNGFPRASGGMLEQWDWHTAPPPYQMTWAAAASNGRLRFVSYPATQRIEWSMPEPDKAARREAWSIAQTLRLRCLERLTTGPTLNWTERDGWRAIESTRPVRADARRHWLFLLQGRRARVWLYPSADGYTVRTADTNLEVSAATPGQAFSAMRVALSMYQARYGLVPTVKLKGSRRTLSVCRSDLMRSYKARLQQVCFTDGFWRGAEMFNRLAHAHLEADRRLSAAERQQACPEG